ncbi:MAG: hypothetical protein JNM93_01655 [Bacteriovoracaceae bacterium]|nr:hypothetical protein [Bacteriovoracaceae bacterium]
MHFLSNFLYYRVFDVADEINLAKLTQLLSPTDSKVSRFALKKINRSVFIAEAPVMVSIEPFELELGGVARKIEVSFKIWNFGAISIQFKIIIQKEMTLKEIRELALIVENHDPLFDRSKEYVVNFLKSIKESAINPNFSGIYEDYLIYQMINQHGSEYTKELLENNDLYNLLILDNESALSHQTVEGIKSDIYQYSKDDLAIIDWNSALLVDRQDDTDIADVIEYAVVQILEMQYYDDLLDKRAGALYDSIKLKKKTILTNQYSKLSEEAAKIYMEISEVVENIENSLKVVGDFYYAKIFRAASKKFRFSDWQHSIDQKLENLKEVSLLLHGEINEKRNQIMEFIIIVLIAVEIVPLFFK